MLKIPISFFQQLLRKLGRLGLRLKKSNGQLSPPDHGILHCDGKGLKGKIGTKIVDDANMDIKLLEVAEDRRPMDHKSSRWRLQLICSLSGRF